MLADIKEPHLDLLGGPNSLSHGSVYNNTMVLQPCIALKCVV